MVQDALMWLPSNQKHENVMAVDSFAAVLTCYHVQLEVRRQVRFKGQRTQVFHSFDQSS